MTSKSTIASQQAKLRQRSKREKHAASEESKRKNKMINKKEKLLMTKNLKNFKTL